MRRTPMFIVVGVPVCSVAVIIAILRPAFVLPIFGWPFGTSPVVVGLWLIITFVVTWWISTGIVSLLYANRFRQLYIADQSHYYRFLKLGLHGIRIWVPPVSVISLFIVYRLTIDMPQDPIAVIRRPWLFTVMLVIVTMVFTWIVAAIALGSEGASQS